MEKKVSRIVLYIFFIVQSLCEKLYKVKKKKIFLNGSPSGGDGVFISLCVRRFPCEPRREQKCVLLKLCECVEMRVHTQGAYGQA